MKIRLLEVVPDTYSNESGFVIYSIIKIALEEGKVIQLSFKGTGALSFSFLNSSFGNLIKEMGLVKFLANVKTIEANYSQANMLKHYIQGFRFSLEA